jgi:IS1 family transposase
VAFYPKKTQKCWVWIAYDRDGKRVCGFELGKRNTVTAKKLAGQLELFDVGLYCTDEYPAYQQTYLLKNMWQQKQKHALLKG